MPPGVAPQPKPAANSAAAVPPGTGALPEQAMATFCPEVGRLADWSVGLAMAENSPSFAKRKELPQLPRTVAPTKSSTTQVKATFGLLVPPVRLGLPP